MDGTDHDLLDCVDTACLALADYEGGRCVAVRRAVFDDEYGLIGLRRVWLSNVNARYFTDSACFELAVAFHNIGHALEWLRHLIHPSFSGGYVLYPINHNSNRLYANSFDLGSGPPPELASRLRREHSDMSKRLRNLPVRSSDRVTSSGLTYEAGDLLYHSGGHSRDEAMRNFVCLSNKPFTVMRSVDSTIHMPTCMSDFSRYGSYTREGLDDHLKATESSDRVGHL